MNLHLIRNQEYEKEVMNGLRERGDFTFIEASYNEFHIVIWNDIRTHSPRAIHIILTTWP